jgi:hypothetical protein
MERANEQASAPVLQWGLASVDYPPKALSNTLLRNRVPGQLRVDTNAY